MTRGPVFVTAYGASYAADVTGGGAETFLRGLVQRGRQCAKLAGHTVRGDDLALAACLAVREMRDDDHHDYLAAGDITDRFSDNDCKLLAQVEPTLALGSCLSDMTVEATALHDFLLDVVEAARRRWETP
jgi:hypothetical protein